MPGIHLKGDRDTGHGCYAPRANIEGSGNVYVNGKSVHRKGDAWSVHCCGPSCHASTLAGGSSSVFANKKQLGRIGDPVACGSVAAKGSSNVFAGG